MNRPGPKVLRVVPLFCLILAARGGAQVATGTGAWADSARGLIDAGVNTGRADALDPAIALLDRVLTEVPNDPVLLHYRGYALYRKATLLQKQPREASAALDAANKSLEQSEKTLAWPETFALRAAVYGQMIGASPNPIRAMRLGPKSDHEMALGVARGPSNPRVFLLRGVGAIFKPSMFGGGLDKAERDLKSALELFAADKPAPPAPSWGYAEAWAWLGQVYAKQNRLDDAHAAYDQALAIQPDYDWVTAVLLPELDRKKR
jgi:tetratricopeptide (TPR) repeat protein